MGKEWKRSRSRSISTDRLPAQYRLTPNSERRKHTFDHKVNDRKRDRSESSNERDSYKRKRTGYDSFSKNSKNEERDHKYDSGKNLKDKDLPRKPKKLDSIQKTLLRLAGGYCEENTKGSHDEKGKKKRKKSVKHSKKKHKKKHKRRESSSDSEHSGCDKSSSSSKSSQDSENEKVKRKKSKHKKKHRSKKEKKKERKRDAKKKKMKHDKKKRKENHKKDHSSSEEEGMNMKL